MLLDSEEFYEHKAIVVSGRQRTMRLDVFVASWLRHFSRSLARRSIQTGAITVDGAKVKVAHLVKPGQRIALQLPYPPMPPLEAEDLPLQIVYEDEALLIIDKAAGIVCHPTASHKTGTLLHGLLYYFELLQSTGRLSEGDRPLLVHRLDSQTSGLMVIAKCDAAALHLSHQFAERTAGRTYEAVTWGDITKPTGIITGHIGRDPRVSNRWAVFTDGSCGKSAITNYEVIERYGIATRVRCRLQTGRTHQIRLHFQHISHPLIGDPVYGGNGEVLWQSGKFALHREFMHIREVAAGCLELINRQALHAATLALTHPLTGQRMKFESALPCDFVQLIEYLQLKRIICGVY